MDKTFNAQQDMLDYKDMHFMIQLNTESDHYPPHWHTPVEIIMPIENQDTVYIGNKTYIIQPYEILFISPKTLHSIEAPSAGMRYILLADLSILKEIYGINQILSFIGSFALFTPSGSPEIYMQLKNIFLDLCSDYFKNEDLQKPVKEKIISPEQNPGSLYELTVYSKLINMLSLIGHNYIESRTADTVSPNRRQEYANKFMDICEYIDKHCAEDLTLEDISLRSGFSKYHFSRLFKEFTNVSFYKYVNQKRIAIAGDLLLNTNLNITEIALQSGFGSISAFIRMFKLINDCTPTEFRNMRDSGPASPRKEEENLGKDQLTHKE